MSTHLSAKDCEECLMEFIDTIDIAKDMATWRAAKVWCNCRSHCTSFSLQADARHYFSKG